MRLLEGSRAVEAGADWREGVLARGLPVVIDIGAGDGRWVYESARRDPATLYVGLDPDAASLAEYAYRAARKPARGGVDNAVYVVAALEALPPELKGLAGTVRVNFPWAGLLRGLVRPDQAALAALKSLLAPGGRVEIVLCYDLERDRAALEGEDVPALGDDFVHGALATAYTANGLPITGARRLTTDEALLLPSSWGRRLLHGRPRTVYLLTATPE